MKVICIIVASILCINFCLFLADTPAREVRERVYRERTASIFEALKAGKEVTLTPDEAKTVLMDLSLYMIDVEMSKEEKTNFLQRITFKIKS